jgi:hypothetical protein
LRRVDPIGGSCYVARTLRRLRYLPVGARALGLAGLLAGVGLATACGPIEYGNQVSGKAARAVAAAKQAGAERYAPYEYASAVEYLHKAREEGGYAEYQVAIDYGHRAEDFAIKARAISEEQMAARGSGDRSVAVPPVAPGDSP